MMFQTEKSYSETAMVTGAEIDIATPIIRTDVEVVVSISGAYWSSPALQQHNPIDKTCI